MQKDQGKKPSNIAFDFEAVYIGLSFGVDRPDRRWGARLSNFAFMNSKFHVNKYTTFIEQLHDAKD